MKIPTLITVCFFVNFVTYPQDNSSETTQTETTYSNAQLKKAEPKNGIEVFKTDFAKTILIPTKKIFEINLRQIRLITSFKVSENGTISDVKIINDKHNLINEVTEAFNNLEKWIPAQENGKNVSSTNNLSLVLNLGLPDYELDENRVPKIALQKADFDAFHKEFNSYMFYPKDFWERYYYKKGSYDTGNNYTSNEFKYVVKFIVNEKGEFEDVKTYINDKYDSHLNAPVKKALAKCRPWEPATINGEKIKSSFELPITMSIKK